MHISISNLIVTSKNQFESLGTKRFPPIVAYATKVWMSTGLFERDYHATCPHHPGSDFDVSTGVAARCGGPSVVWSLQYRQSFRILCSSAQEDACNHRCDHSESGSLIIHNVELKDRQIKKMKRVTDQSSLQV